MIRSPAAIIADRRANLNELRLARCATARAMLAAHIARLTCELEAARELM